MFRSRRRLLLLIGFLPVLILVATPLYMVGMRVLENDPRSFLDALEFVAETVSTTGYGADSRWTHPLMVVFVIVLQFLGVFLVFLIFPIYLIPFLEERFEARLPKAVPALDGAVLVYRSGPAVTSLVDELERARVPVVQIEDDAAEARRLVDGGHKVVFGGLEEGVLERAGLIRARALVANGTDDENAAVILSARAAGFGGDILALVEEPAHRKPMMLAGATAAYTPRHILGAALAARASARLTPRVAGAQGLGRRLALGEVRISRGSELAGKTLGQADIGRRTGVVVLGQWVGGRLIAQPNAETELLPGAILVVAGSDESLQRFDDECAGATTLERTGPFVVAGYGEVGHKVVQLLRDAGEQVQVIDKRDREGVDQVGDILDQRVLESSEVLASQAVVLAVDSDMATLFATVILKDFAPRVPVIARVNEAQNVERIHHAGADFALSISQVAGQILAGRLLGQESVSLDPRLKVLKVGAQALADHHPAELGIRERTGASVVAVERDDSLVVEFGPEFRFQADDEIYICGDADATQKFLAVF